MSIDRKALEAVWQDDGKPMSFERLCWIVEAYESAKSSIAGQPVDWTNPSPHDWSDMTDKNFCTVLLVAANNLCDEIFHKKLHQECVRRLSEREYSPPWQPIETAPKDRPGSLWFWLEDEGFPVKARWMKPPIPGGDDDEECWWCFEQDCSLNVCGNATHWMDMPPGPSAQRRRGSVDEAFPEPTTQQLSEHENRLRQILADAATSDIEVQAGKDES